VGGEGGGEDLLEEEEGVGKLVEEMGRREV